MIEINCSTKTKDYDCSNVNEVLALVASISGTLEQKKSDTNLKKSDKYRFVLEAGLEPARAKAHRILSPACLPIPPLEHHRTYSYIV